MKGFYKTENLCKSLFAKVLTVLILFLFFTLNNAFALVPENHLPEPQEKRARELFLQIRCPICAGQVIESSNTEISFHLRSLVRQKIVDGKSDEEIKADLVAEYGEEILNYPTSNLIKYTLWVLPLIFIFIAWAITRKFIRHC